MSEIDEAKTLLKIDSNLEEAKREISTANDKLDDIMQAQRELRDSQDVIIESQAEHTAMLRGVVEIKNAVIGINANTKWVAASVAMMAMALVSIAVICVVAITKTSFTGEASAFGANANMTMGNK